ncbi:MAG: hypothetical protein AAF317_04860 [Pseudomonadota bacterium]
MPRRQQQPRGQGHAPVDVIRDGAIKATIWENQGQKGTYLSTTFAKTYEDQNGDLKDTNTFTQSELLRVSELARKAYDRGNELRQGTGQESDPGRRPQVLNDRQGGPEGNTRRSGRSPGYER